MQQTDDLTSEGFNLNPPGGLLLWIIIGMELLSFIVGIAFFLGEKADDPGLFISMQGHLDLLLGTINTIILISGGFTAVTAITELRQGNSVKSGRYVLASFFTGLLFLGLKSIEYQDKLISGFDMSYNTFFTFYWLLTGFHFIHVALAIVLLFVMYLKIKKGEYNRENMENPESITAFWHMCDLIWIMLFPVIYLIR